MEAQPTLVEMKLVKGITEMNPRLAASTVVLVFCLVANAWCQETFSFSVLITRQENSELIEGAKCGLLFRSNDRVERLQAQTDEMGVCKFDGLPSGAWLVASVEKDGYRTIDAFIAPDAVDDGAVRIVELRPAGAAGGDETAYRVETQNRRTSAWIPMKFQFATEQEGKDFLHRYVRRQGDEQFFRVTATARNE